MEKILVATDFSLQSMRLPDCVEDLGNCGAKSVVLMHVLGEEGEDAEDSEVRRSALARLEVLRDRLVAKDFEVTISLTWGKAAVEIQRAAARENADMIVMAPHNKGYLRRALWGSTSLELVKMASCPILLEKGDGQLGEEGRPAHFKKIMVPTDFSLASLAALDFIRSIREYIGEVIFVNVVESGKNLEERIEQAELSLAELVEELNDFGIQASSFIGKGSPGKEIVDIAEELTASMVILPKVGGGFVKNLLLGSTAQAVASALDIPVMLVPAETDR